MIDGILDSTVIIHALRRYKPALAWLNSEHVYGVTSITWMEVIGGARGKSHLAESSDILQQFALLYLTAEDQQWAMERLVRFQFTHHIGMNDCLIAAVAYRLGLPLYTHNLKDMRPLIGELAVKPYA